MNSFEPSNLKYQCTVQYIILLKYACTWLCYMIILLFVQKIWGSFSFSRFHLLCDYCFSSSSSPSLSSPSSQLFG